jgi:hypothetical protein
MHGSEGGDGESRFRPLSEPRKLFVVHIPLTCIFEGGQGRAEHWDLSNRKKNMSTGKCRGGCQLSQHLKLLVIPDYAVDS